MIKVDLLDWLGTDDTVVDAARVSFDKEASNYTGEQNARLVDYLATHNHNSPFRHCFVQFRVSAPIFVARQLVKHQVGLSWNEVSRRYVDGNVEFYLPELLRAQATNRKQGSSSEAIDENEYWLVRMFDFYDRAEQLYNALLDAGVAGEQARMVLPVSLMTSWYWSGSLAAFAHVCNLRIHEGAQEETSEVARQIDTYMKDLFPVSWKALRHE